MNNLADYVRQMISFFDGRLSAHSLGLGSVWLNPLMTICDEPEIRELLRSFEVPDTHIVWAMLALGYPAQEGKLLAKRQDVVKWVE